MSEGPRKPSIDLPTTLAIFPLTGVLLLPRGRLPLNIFEPRYLNMTADALAAPRLIGMVQPRRAVSELVPDAEPAYDVGCAGRITAFTETDDGHYQITLTGTVRFRIVDEIAMLNGYRRIRPDFGPYLDDLIVGTEAIEDRDGLLKTLRAYFHAKHIEADFAAIESSPDEAVVTALAMLCPFSSEEKQALMEAPGTTKRAELLRTLMDMAVGESLTPTTEARH
ncbi:MAG: peptidase S16 [Rhodospirillales bacterium]|nr:peptidase S16 [Rhodospirillales bacterium]